MGLPADHRAHCISITAAMLAEQLQNCALPADANARVLGLIDQIRDSAEILRAELAPSAVAPTPRRVGNVIPLRSH